MNYDDLARRIVAQRNTLQEDDFDGFSPHQMSIIVYSPFSDDCPVDMRTQVDTALLDQSPIFQIAKHLLKEMKDNEGIKLTSTGNLPPRIVNEIYARNYITDSAIEAGITKLNQEAKWDILHCSKIVLKLPLIVLSYTYDVKGAQLEHTNARKRKVLVGQQSHQGLLECLPEKNVRTRNHFVRRS